LQAVCPEKAQTPSARLTTTHCCYWQRPTARLKQPEEFARTSITAVPHPVYSPDLSSYDYRLSIRNMLHGLSLNSFMTSRKWNWYWETRSNLFCKQSVAFGKRLTRWLIGVLLVKNTEIVTLLIERWRITINQRKEDELSFTTQCPGYQWSCWNVLLFEE
jgi:hypothetical protein